MNLSRFYSHRKEFNPIQAKRQSSQKNTSPNPPIKTRSVTYNNDQDILKLINNNENLLELIEKIQKQRQVQRLDQEAQSNIKMPSISKEQKSKSNIYQKSDRKRKHQSIPYTFQLNPKNIPYYQQNRILGKFIEPTEYKKIDYDSMKTIETAIAKQIYKQQQQEQEQFNKVKENSIDLDLASKQSIELQINKNNNQDSQLKLNSGLSDTQFEQQTKKIKKIVQNAHNLRKQMQQQILQQKIQLEFEIKDEFLKYLDANQTIQIIQSTNTQEDEQDKLTNLQQKIKIKRN